MGPKPEMVELPDRREWRLPNGLRHREDGPAREWLDGGREWYINGRLHREDGPAVEFPDRREWYVRGQLHREDGPAIERADGSRKWWVRGRPLTEEEFNTHRFRMWAVEGRLVGQEELV